jgi:von Willebrand factor type A domain
MKNSFFQLFYWILFLISIQNIQGGTGTIDASGNMHFSVNFRFVPTQVDIDGLKAQLRAASLIICDATDGQARFGTIRITAGAAEEAEADIWVYAEPGRSGVSVFGDGSGFGRLGNHITLFQSGIDGITIAHELGHLAFGLFDEYDEQCRFGGSCGIGGCGVPNLLMEGSGDWSELCVASNHDLTRGSNQPCPASTGVCLDGVGMALPPCGDDNYCKKYWNTTTNRFETTQQSDLHNNLSCWATLAQNYPPIFTPPAGLPTDAAPSAAVCGTPTFVDAVVGSDQVMLFIDRSGSMSEKENPSDPNSQSRLDFAKAAARAFIDLRAGTGSQVGLVSFATTPRLDRRIIDLGFADGAAFKATVDGLVAGENTGIGTALNAATFEFQGVAAAGRTRTAFLLSDGQNNEGENPVMAAQRLRNEGVRLFTIPCGSSADHQTLTELAGSNGGQMISAPSGLELPPIYFEFVARLRSESLVLNRTESFVKSFNRDIKSRSTGVAGVFQSKLPNGKNEFIDSLGFYVERFVPRLNIMISARQGNVTNWKTQFRLRGPNGEVFTNTNTDVIVRDTYYTLIRLNNPSAGNWILEIASANEFDQSSYVIAHAENPKPDLFVHASPRVVTPSKSVNISVVTSYAVEIEKGATFTGRVRRPDGSLIPITLTRNPISRSVSANFNSYNGRGIYEVQTETKVRKGAEYLQGESIFSGGPNTTTVPDSFARSASTYFFLDSNTLPPCNSDDCDNDGIKNDDEGNFDTDGDLIPDSRDQDSDGDDVPDSQEGTRDDDGDGIPNFQDPDSDNDGIKDGIDPDNRVNEGGIKNKMWYSLHTGASLPVGITDQSANANINVQVDLTYNIKSNLNMKLLLGYNQFTTELVGNQPNPRWFNASANVQWLANNNKPFRSYLQLGPGIYKNDKINLTNAGFNVGVGGISRLNNLLFLCGGVDFHHVFTDKTTNFLTVHIGIVFR